MLKSPLPSQPEDVAKAICHVIDHPQAEVVVGTGAIATNFYRFIPGLSQWLLQRSVAKSSAFFLFFAIMYSCVHKSEK